MWLMELMELKMMRTMKKTMTMTKGAFIRTEASPQLNECEYVGRKL